ncbi:MAG: MHYT domain-containing protein [Gammaproteobacteria bacterium]|nr:MHYT domain-containing protein [Gammaproteobacteria bacterium]
MLENFFQLTPPPLEQIKSWYDPKLVILSYVVAVFASYIALDITGRLRDISNTERSTTLWLIGGAFAFGAGIWSMHFIGMLAFKMDMPMQYDLSLTILSMIVAICASGFALMLLNAQVITLTNYILGGIILGLAIAAMHYTGMAAMKITMDIHYLPGLFFLSILIAIIASEAAIWLALKSTQVISRVQFRLKFVSAFIMGAAICGMHYTGMAAAIFTPKMHINYMHNALDPEVLSISIASVTFIVLGIAFIASTYKESLNQQMLLTARQAGMAEVAASVLHNVGNVLNSVNVSSFMISEKVQNSKLSTLIDLNKLIEDNKNHFDEFVKNDPRGKKLPDFIHSLTHHWKIERDSLNSEIAILLKNIEHIRNIIATQQDISRVSDSEQVISIINVLDECMLMTGIDNPKCQIQIKKDYESIKPVVVDKAKVLQILVNLIQNAKDALSQSQNEDKFILIKVTHNKHYFSIEITDNGAGISSADLTKIFAYGFTTKKKGHGFGLHTSAIYAKEMAGSLRVSSLGKGKGASFILELPYNTQEKSKK